MSSYRILAHRRPGEDLYDVMILMPHENGNPGHYKTLHRMEIPGFVWEDGEIRKLMAEAWS